MGGWRVTFRYSVFRHKDDNRPQNVESNWEAFKERLGKPLQTAVKDDAGLWSPAGYPKDKTRSKANVEAVSAVVYDFDSQSCAVLEHVRQIASGLQCAIHSTFRHLIDGPEDNRFRVIIPFAEPLTPAQFQRAHSALLAVFEAKGAGDYLKLPPGEQKAVRAVYDDSQKHCAAFFYWPTIRPEAKTFIFEAFTAGELLKFSDIEKFEALTPSLAKAAKSPAAAIVTTSGAEPDFKGANFPKAHREKFKQRFLTRIQAKWTKDRELKVFYSALRSGTPFAPLGQGVRDKTLQAFVSRIAFALADDEIETVPEDLIFEMMKASLDATSSPDDENPIHAKAEEKFRRARRDAWRSREEQKQLAVNKKAENLPALIPVEYPENHLEALLDLSGGQTIRPLLVYKGVTFLLTPQGYVGPKIKHDFYAACRRYAPNLRVTKLDKAGEEVVIKYENVLSYYGYEVSNHCYSYKTSKDYYDEGKDTVYTSCAKRSHATPVYDEQIAVWLEAASGLAKDKLYDWLATCGNLSKPTSILYLEGPPRTGKSLLAALIATLWQNRRSVDMVDVLGTDFNDALLKTPLIVADEALPKRRGDISAELRSMVAAESRPVKQKFLPVSHLEGCVRIVITANNDAIFRFKEILTESDAQAIAERVLHIKVAAQATEVLDGLSKATLQSWVDGKFANFVAWLESYRKPICGPRFLVSGESDQLVSQYRLTEPMLLVCRYLIHGLMTCFRQKMPKENPRRIFNDNVVINNAGLHVNQEAFVCEDLWREISTGDRIQESGEIRKILKSLRLNAEKSSGTVHHAGRETTLRAWLLNTDVVLAACADLQMDEDFLRQILYPANPIVPIPRASVAAPPPSASRH